MMNSDTKKWLVLGSLLALTLVLVWKAPESESASTAVVQAVRQPHQSMQATDISERQSAPSVLLTERAPQPVEVDIFNTPHVAVKTVVRPVIPIVKPTIQVKQVRLPFSYIGKLEQAEQTTLFVMNGTALHLVKTGDEVDGFKLIKIDVDKQQVQWLHLASNQTQKMSMTQ